MGGTSKSELPMSIACERALAQLAAFGAKYPLISSNVELRRYGLPRSDRVEPTDPGVAVYFSKGGRPYSLACETFRRAADNRAAITGPIDANPRQRRYGVATAEESPRGFGPLPPPHADVAKAMCRDRVSKAWWKTG